VTYLLDTNVLSELPKPRPHTGVLAWVEGLTSLSISAVSLEELTYGVERATGRKRAQLRTWLDELLLLSPVVIAIDARIARVAGALRANRDAKGRPVAQADMLVAACALTSGLVLATRNVRDFEGCGVALFNPFAQ
jgi:predicted nucleic acid-binding protein